MSLFSLIDTSQGLNQTQVDARIDALAMEKMDNVVVVKQESDFGVAVGGVITLQPNTSYVIGVAQLITTAEIMLPTSGSVQISGQDAYLTTWIFAASNKTLFSNTNRINFRFKTSNLIIIDGTGTNTLFNITGHPTLSYYCEIATAYTFLYGWKSRGLLKDLTLVNINESEHFNCGLLTIDNIFALTFLNFAAANFYPNQQGFQYSFKTNITQANISACAFLGAKNESIFNIDPAINKDSGISIGTAVPFQGNVFASISKFENIGGGKIRITCPNGHSFDNGDSVLIRYTSNYNGVFAVSNVVKFNPSITAGTFEITATFVSDNAQGQAILLNGSTPKIESFFKQGTIATITSVSNSGGLALFTTSGVAPTTGQSLYISGTTNYDQGGYAINVSPTTFTLLDSLGQPVSFIANETLTNAKFNTGSLDQTNNVVSVNNAGGIIPDSQILGNNILTSTIAFASTTTLTRVSTGTWLSTRTERVKATSDGRLIYVGKTVQTLSISGKLVCRKQSGTASTAFVNVMVKRAGTASFVEIPSYPKSQDRVNSADSTQLSITTIIDNVSPLDEIALGFASDTAFTIDIFSIDLNIKK